MDKHSFKITLQKYQQKSLTKEEQDLLYSYYNLYQNEPDILDEFSNEEKDKFKALLKDDIWNNISHDEKSLSKVRSLNKTFIKVAVAATFIGFLSAVFFLFNRSPDKPAEKITSLVENKSNSVIFLADGSSVMLSYGSKLNYPSSFVGKEKREVYLTGQAFFDIKHNASKPFLVHTGKVITEVLGTAFNIKAFPNEKDITVTVKRGRVKVIDQDKTLGIITPNQQITFNKEKVNTVINIVPNDNYLDWKNEDLFIDNLTISEAAKILEEEYKVKIIIYDSSIREQRFTATFSKDEKLEEALKSITVFNGLEYKYIKDKSTVIINDKEPKANL